jgi:hypothetical protein
MEARQMPQLIEDYQEKTNKQLLIELVVQGNSQCRQNEQIITHLSRLNGSVAKHESRIVTLESQMGERTVPAWMASRWRVAGMGTLAISIATAIAVGMAELIKCL